jgi:hypothetical protein
MIQGQFKPFGERQHLLMAERSRLSKQYPVLLPLILIFGSGVLGIASFYTNVLFPLLAIIGVPTALLCLSAALVLGMAGVLASIISILETIDRLRVQTTTFPKPKGA